MKILKIEFTNINSLRGTHEIDFTQEPFISSSLFAITGPTGSGKSTILDVIALALYGKIPRIPGSRPISKTDIEKFGTILTRNQKEAIARVTYECKLGIFSSQWSISTNRNDNLRDNDMEIYDHQKQELITDKKSDVPDKNEELIGLSYDQFIKAVLLAQGEFAQFLKVSRKERGALLEKITGTGVYRLIGQKVYERNGVLNKDIEKQQTEIKILKDNLLEDEILKLKEKELLEKLHSQNTFQKQIEEFKKALKLKEEIQKKSNGIKLLDVEKASEIKNLEAFDVEHGAPLKQHEKVQEYSEELRNWNLLSKEIKNLDVELSSNKENKEANSSKTSELITNVSSFTGVEVSSENFNTSLSNFRNKVFKLNEERTEKLNLYKLEKIKLMSEIQSLDIAFIESKPEETIKEIQGKISIIKKSVEDWNSEFKVSTTDEIEALKIKLQKEYRNTREAAREYSSIENVQNELTRHTSELETLQPQLKTLPQEIDKQEHLVKNLRTTHENLHLKKENQLLKASLEQHRHKLKDGDACPLCGALHHPFAEHLPEKEDYLEEEIKNINNELTTQISTLNAYTNNLANYKKQATILEARSKLLNKELKEIKEIFQKKFGSLAEVINLKELEKACDTQEIRIENLVIFKKEQKKLQHLKAALPILKELQIILQDGKLLKEKLDELYSGNDIQKDVEIHQNRWVSLERDLKNLLELQDKISKQLSSKQEELQNLEADLSSKLKEKGFNDINDGFSVLMPDSEANRLRLERQQIKTRIDNSLASTKLLKTQLEELQKQDTKTDEVALNKLLQEKTSQLDIFTKEAQEIDRILKNQQEYLERMRILQTQIAEKEIQTRRWRMLNELVGDRTGNKFNDFAQDLSLSRLISLANVQLKDLSDRYLIDKPTDEEDDGLVAIDEHMGGQRRSVKTLSGGETFILSLSMALALSDLASKNVAINSLFIDEGFGTLDPETLDQTLDTLEKLQTESSKTIGIISHVDSLKERIATQIKLTRNGQGYSTLKVESL